MTRISYISAILTLCVIFSLYSVGFSLAAQLTSDDQITTTITTTVSPARLPIFREQQAERTEIDTQQQKQDASRDATKTHGTLRASERLMKELRDISRSDSYKNGLLEVDLVNDNLYEWRVNLSFPDPECTLHSELKKLASEGKGEHVVLRVTFGDNYPKEPPFVRIAYPALEGRWIHAGGALCMKQLSKQFWDSESTMEGLILSIVGQLLESKAKLSDNFEVDLESYTDEQARESFKNTVGFHEKNGW